MGHLRILKTVMNLSEERTRMVCNNRGCYPITVHHSYAFSTAWARGVSSVAANKQTNVQTNVDSKSWAFSQTKNSQRWKGSLLSLTWMCRLLHSESISNLNLIGLLSVDVAKETSRTRSSIEIWDTGWRNYTPNAIGCTFFSVSLAFSLSLSCLSPFQNLLRAREICFCISEFMKKWTNINLRDVCKLC